MVIPRSLREEAGVSEGTLMKVAVVDGGRFLLTPQHTVEHAKPAKARKSRKGAFRELAKIVTELRQEAKEKGVDRMSRASIHRAVTAVRRDLKKRRKRLSN